MNLELDDQQAAALVLGGRRDAGIAVNQPALCIRNVHQKSAISISALVLNCYLTRPPNFRVPKIFDSGCELRMT